MEQEDFLSPKHSQLLNIAIWAKYLAWIVFIFYIIRVAFVPLFSQMYYEQMNFQQDAQSFWSVVMEKPVYNLLNIGSDMVSTFLRGAIFYIVLKGISLGLYMIVETDINYREQEKLEGKP